jgi:hypothetical protein
MNYDEYENRSLSSGYVTGPDVPEPDLKNLPEDSDGGYC